MDWHSANHEAYIGLQKHILSMYFQRIFNVRFNAAYRIRMFRHNEWTWYNNPVEIISPWKHK
jgi:hypothetical protein